MSKEQAPGDQTGGSTRSAEEKVRIVMAAEGLRGEALGAFLRREGVHGVEVEQWRDAIIGSAKSVFEGPAAKGSTRAADAKRIKELERELRRKDKALAETAALLVLQKKVRAIWGDEDDDTSERNEK